MFVVRYMIEEVDADNEEFVETAVLGKGLVVSDDGKGSIKVRQTFSGVGPEGKKIPVSVDLSYSGSLPPPPEYLNELKSAAKSVAKRRKRQYRMISFNQLAFSFCLTQNIALEKNCDFLPHFQVSFDNLGQYHIPFGDIMEPLECCITDLDTGRSISLIWTLDHGHPSDAAFTDELGWPANKLFGKLQPYYIGGFVETIVIHIVDASSMQPITIDDFFDYIKRPIQGDAIYQKLHRTRIDLVDKSS